MNTAVLAPQAAGRPTIGQSLEVLTFGLQGEIFAIEAGIVREILDHALVTDVPNARPLVGGLINVRGKVVPLADLRVVFDMERTPPTVDTRVIVIETDIGGEPTIIGILADKVYEVTELAATSLAEVPRIGMTWRPEFIRFFGRRGADFVVVPDLVNIFS